MDEDEATLCRVIDSTPIIDNHAHPLLKFAAIDKHPLLALATEAHGDALGASRTGLAHFRAVKQLAAILGCDCSWDAVAAAIQERRAGQFDAWTARCLEGIQCVLVDDGLDNADDAESYDFFDKFAPSASKRIVRIEAIAAVLVDKALSEYDDGQEALEAVIDQFRIAIEDALDDTEVVGFKSVICYRTGLAIPRKQDIPAARQAFQDIFQERQRNPGTKFTRLDHRGLNELFVHQLASLIANHGSSFMKPVQFHTGLGDNDITLTKASPSHMQEFIREYPTVPIVLLHASYPFTREAGYLAAMYANVYADIGEVFPFLSRDGQEGVVRQILELCPGAKILWSTDGHWFPETYLLAVEQVREVFKTVFCEYMRKGDMTLAQATSLVEDVFFHNSNKLYDLRLKPKKPVAGSHQPVITKNEKLRILSQALEGVEQPQFLRICWSDMTGTLRMRSIPIRRAKSLLSSDEEFSFGIVKAALAVTQIDMPAAGASATAEFRLHTDWTTVIRGPRAGHVMTMGDFKEENGQESNLCPRTVFKNTLSAGKTLDLTFLLGFEIELVLFRRGDNGKLEPLDVDGHAWSVSRPMEHDAVISVIEEAVADLDAAGVYVELVHPESAKGQFEVILPKASPLKAIDTLLCAREVLSSKATSKGYKMTLHPKPYPKLPGTAAHVHMSMSTVDGPAGPEIYESFYAGVLKHLGAICALTCSSRASYERLQPGAWAGSTWVAWGTQNRETPLRKIEDSHWELKAIDGLSNPYLAMSAVLGAGINGVRERETLTWRDCAHDPASLSKKDRGSLGIDTQLPQSIKEALTALQQDETMKDILGEELVDRYVNVKEAEEAYLAGKDADEVKAWLMERY